MEVPLALVVYNQFCKRGISKTTERVQEIRHLFIVQTVVYLLASVISTKIKSNMNVGGFKLGKIEIIVDVWEDEKTSGKIPFTHTRQQNFSFDSG